MSGKVPEYRAESGKVPDLVCAMAAREMSVSPLGRALPRLGAPGRVTSSMLRVLTKDCAYAVLYDDALLELLLSREGRCCSSMPVSFSGSGMAA